MTGTQDAGIDAGIEATLRRLAARAFDLDGDPQTLPHTGLLGQFGIESISAVRYLLDVSMEFGLEIDDPELGLGLADDFAALARYVRRRLAGPA